MYQIAIIIPVYNNKNYLEECLNSILKQTLTNIQIICIDDCSTDGSDLIIKEYQKSHKNILFKRNSYNNGPAFCRNLGISIAKAEFVCFMDADDFYPSDKVLEKLYKTIIENRVNVCGGSLIECVSSSSQQILKNNIEIKNDFTFKKDGLIRYYDYQFEYGFTRFVYKLSFLKKNRLYFPNYRSYEDPVFFVNVMSKSKKFYAIRDIVYCYRFGHQSQRQSGIKFVHRLQGISDLLCTCNVYQYFKLKNNTVKRLSNMTNKIKNELKGDYKNSIIKQLLKINVYLLTNCTDSISGLNLTKTTSIYNDLYDKISDEFMEIVNSKKYRFYLLIKKPIFKIKHLFNKHSS